MKTGKTIIQQIIEKKKIDKMKEEMKEALINAIALKNVKNGVR